MPQPPIEWKRTAMAPLGQERRRVLADDGVGVVDPEHEEGLAVAAPAAVRAARLARGELVGAERVLGPEVAGADAVGAAEQARRLLRREGREGPPNFAASLALPRATRMSRASGLSPASPSSVRSRMITFFLPRSALMTAASGNGRMTLIWIEPTFALRCSRR
jgi:hypothetical protein